MEALRRFRWVGFLVIAVAAVVVTLAIGNAGAGGGQTVDGVRSALADYDLNEALADSAPQQTVTAEWASKDLLAVIGRAEARQSGALGTKIPLLLLLGIVAICWHGVTLLPTGARERSEVAGESSEPPATRSA